MKRFLFFLIFASAAGILAWRYAPADMRQKGAAFISIVLKRDGKEFKKFVADAVIPQSPEKKREILIEELKSNIGEIKKRAVVSFKAGGVPIIGNNDMPRKESKKNNSENPNAKIIDTPPANIATKELIIRSEKIIQELEKANNDSGLQREVASRVLDKILPSKEEPVHCISDEKTN